MLDNSLNSFDLAPLQGCVDIPVDIDDGPDRFSPRFGFPPVWQRRHFARKIGRASFSNVSSHNGQEGPVVFRPSLRGGLVFQREAPPSGDSGSVSNKANVAQLLALMEMN